MLDLRSLRSGIKFEKIFVISCDFFVWFLLKIEERQPSTIKSHFRCIHNNFCLFVFVLETGVCTSYGDPHYQTFDGRMFNFHGTCRYQLTSDCVENQFTVRMRNEQRYSNVYAWSKALTIHLSGSVIVLHKDLQVKVNKSDVDLPYYHLPHFQIIKDSFMVTLVTNIGLQVREKRWSATN